MRLTYKEQTGRIKYAVAEFKKTLPADCVAKSIRLSDKLINEWLSKYDT